MTVLAVMRPRTKQYYFGVDGARAGWLIAGRGTHPSDDCLILTDDPIGFARLSGAVTAIDMPIGLSDEGPRPCEWLARDVLGPRRASIFFSPPAPTLALADWAEANAWAKAETGRGISKQTWNIIPRIRVLVDAITPADQAHIIEAHPELAFQRLNGDAALPSKKSPEGQALRRALLEAAGFTKLEDWATALPRKWVAVDDIYDACVLTLTAAHFDHGTAIALPEQADVNARGLKMQIWY